MEITNPIIEKYINQHTSSLSKLLDNLERETQLKTMHPRMLSGKMQGKFLEILIKSINPKNVLEIGTFTGYSAICMASALQQDAHLHTIDCNEELEPFVKKYFKAANLENKITFHIGEAVNVIPKLNINFDFIFIDADKKNYLNYYNLLIDKISKDAIIIADNVLWSGKIIETPSKNDLDTIGLQQFNDFVQNDSRVENVILPIRDGLMMMIKK